MANNGNSMWDEAHPRWKGKWALVTPQGRCALLLLETEGTTQGLLWELEASIDEAFNRWNVRCNRVDRGREQVSDESEFEPAPTLGMTVSDGFGSEWPPCEVCGSTLQVVRPGDARCYNCESVKQEAISER